MTEGVYDVQERVYECTDGNTVFRCDSDKNSLVIISML